MLSGFTLEANVGGFSPIRDDSKTTTRSTSVKR
jgi:hypothetical protein